MLEQPISLKTPKNKEVNFFLIDEDFWEKSKVNLSFQKLNWELYHYRDDNPAFLLSDGRVIHKFMYSGFLHLFNSLDDFLSCFKKDRYYLVTLYSNVNQNIIYRYFHYVDIDFSIDEFIQYNVKDNYHESLISQKGEIIYLFLPHKLSGFWFENELFFNNFMPYYKGEK